MMKMTRREFVAAGLAGIAGLHVSHCLAATNEINLREQLPDEDGYKLWLRYTPPGDMAKSYRGSVRQIRVEGASATCEIIR